MSNINETKRIPKHRTKKGDAESWKAHIDFAHMHDKTGKSKEEINDMKRLDLARSIKSYKRQAIKFSPIHRMRQGADRVAHDLFLGIKNMKRKPKGVQFINNSTESLKSELDERRNKALAETNDAVRNKLARQFSETIAGSTGCLAGVDRGMDIASNAGDDASLILEKKPKAKKTTIKEIEKYAEEVLARDKEIISELSTYGAKDGEIAKELDFNPKTRKFEETIYIYCAKKKKWLVHNGPEPKPKKKSKIKESVALKNVIDAIKSKVGNARPINSILANKNIGKSNPDHDKGETRSSIISYLVGSLVNSDLIKGMGKPRSKLGWKRAKDKIQSKLGLTGYITDRIMQSKWGEMPLTEGRHDNKQGRRVTTVDRRKAYMKIQAKRKGVLALFTKGKITEDEMEKEMDKLLKMQDDLVQFPTYKRGTKNESIEELIDEGKSKGKKKARGHVRTIKQDIEGDWKDDLHKLTSGKISKKEFLQKKKHGENRFNGLNEFNHDVVFNKQGYFRKHPGSKRYQDKLLGLGTLARRRRERDAQEKKDQAKRDRDYERKLKREAAHAAAYEKSKANEAVAAELKGKANTKHSVIGSVPNVKRSTLLRKMINKSKGIKFTHKRIGDKKDGV